MIRIDATWPTIYGQWPIIILWDRNINHRCLIWWRYYRVLHTYNDLVKASFMRNYISTISQHMWNFFRFKILKFDMFLFLAVLMWLLSSHASSCTRFNSALITHGRVLIKFTVISGINPDAIGPNPDSKGKLPFSLIIHIRHVSE